MIRTVVLARLLAPGDFGLFGIAMLALSSLESFSRTGFDQALVQSKEETESYLNTAWTVQVTRGSLLGGILVGGAPLVGAFFGEPRATLIVRVLGAAELLKSLRNIGVIYFRKELEFHKQFLYQFAGTFSDIAVALPFAFVFRSVWALILGLLARNLVKTILSYRIHGYRPRFEFDRDKAIELVNFGRWVLGSSVVVFLATQGDDIFLARVLGTTALGIYQLAYRVSNTPATEITHVIGQVTFPAYSKLQDDLNGLTKAFSRTLNAVISLTLPMTVGIFVLGPDFVRIFLGEKWVPMILPLKILVFAGFVRAVAATGGPLFRAVGEPKIDFKMNLVRVALIAATIYPLTIYWGIAGASISVLLGISGTLPIWWSRSSGATRLSAKSVLKAVTPAFLGSALMGGSLAVLSWLIGSGLIQFFSLILIGAAVYLTSSLLSWKVFGTGPIGSLVILKESIE